MILLVMGVSGVGKTSVATALAEQTGWPLLEGDDLHPKANVEKMSHGTPLNDDDRAPWLAAIAARIDEWRAKGQSGVVTCSALKRRYRDILVGQRPDVRIVYLCGAHDLVADRMAARRGHFMPPGLLDSQFATLEEPAPEEHAIRVGVGPSVPELAEQVLEKIGFA